MSDKIAVLASITLSDAGLHEIHKCPGTGVLSAFGGGALPRSGSRARPCDPVKPEQDGLLEYRRRPPKAMPVQCPCQPKPCFGRCCHINSTSLRVGVPISHQATLAAILQVLSRKLDVGCRCADISVIEVHDPTLNQLQTPPLPARVQLLILDDWGTHGPTDQQRLDLLELFEERYQRRSTIITAQLPVSGWHDMIGEPTIADAILDRIVHNAHRIDLKGDSIRRTDQNRNLTSAENTETMKTET